MAEPVRFNVGGKHYDVSHSLLEQHETSMLTCLVSERWQSQELKTEIFVDRDGEAFRHVLNYMRHGTVCLPISTSKTDFLRDLDYYGILVEDESSVQQENHPTCVHSAILAKTIRRELQRRSKKKPSNLVARECYNTYKQKGELTTRISSNPEILEPSVCDAFDIVFENFDEEHFNESLAYYGLRWKRFESSWGSIYIHVECVSPSPSSEKKYPVPLNASPASLAGPMEMWMDSFAQDNGYQPHGPQGYGYKDRQT